MIARNSRGSVKRLCKCTLVDEDITMGINAQREVILLSYNPPYEDARRCLCPVWQHPTVL